MFAHKSRCKKRCVEDTGPTEVMRKLPICRAGFIKTLPAKIVAKAVFTSIALNELKKENFCCLKPTCLAHLSVFVVKSQ